MIYLKLSFCILGLLVIGFLIYGSIYIIAPRSLHGEYGVSCDWQHWRVAAQPMEMQVSVSIDEATPAGGGLPPDAATSTFFLGRSVQIGPLQISHAK